MVITVPVNSKQPGRFFGEIMVPGFCGPQLLCVTFYRPRKQCIASSVLQKPHAWFERATVLLGVSLVQ